MITLSIPGGKKWLLGGKNGYSAEKNGYSAEINGYLAEKNGYSVEKSCYFLSFYMTSTRKLNKNAIFKKYELFSEK